MEMQTDAEVPAIDEMEGKSTDAKPRLSVKDAAKMSANPIPAGLRAQGDKFVVRLPVNLSKKLLQISRRHRRSMNSEITLLLEQFVARDGAPIGAERIGLAPVVGDLNNAALRLIEKFQQLSMEKKKALLDLLE